MIESKHCSRCGAEKPIELFSRWKYSKDGRQQWCKACQKLEREQNKTHYQKRHAEYYQENKDRLNAQSKDWAKKNPERRKEVYTAYRNRNLDKVRKGALESWKRNYHKPRNRETARESSRRWRARKWNAPVVDLTISQWQDIQARYHFGCAYCIRPFTPEDPVTQDHVIPLSRGGSHTADNVVPAHLTCNSRKRHRTREEFVAA